MPLEKRTLVRVADRIRDQVRSMQSNRYVQLQQKLQHVLEQMQRLKAIQNRLSVCASRRWEAGAERSAAAIEPGLREMTYSIEETQRAVRNGTALRGRSHGALHASHTGGGVGGLGLLSHGGFHRHPRGRLPAY